MTWHNNFCSLSFDAHFDQMDSLIEQSSKYPKKGTADRVIDEVQNLVCVLGGDFMLSIKLCCYTEKDFMV